MSDSSETENSQLEDFQNLSPNLLGPRLQVVQPRIIWALASILGLIFIAFLWSIFGRIPISIKGQGMLIRSGSVREVESIQNGPVSKILVTVGQEVKSGEPLAYIAQPMLEGQIEQAKELVGKMTLEYEKFLQFGDKSASLQQAKMQQEKLNQRQSISYYRNELNSAQDRLRTQKKLYAQGLITKDRLDAVKHSMQNAQENLSRAKLALKQLTVSKVQQEGSRELQQQDKQHSLKEAQNRLQALEAEYARHNTIFSPADGRILELRTSVGDIVQPGRPIMNIELASAGGNELVGISYFNPSEGKKVFSNMKAFISPSTVKHEEFGYLVGQVKAVSKFPATRQGMLRVLHNEDLVNRFLTLTGSAPTMVNIQLTQKSDTPSGYRWSSGNGPELKINAGTLCDVEIITKWQRPITIVLPILTKILSD